MAGAIGALIVSAIAQYGGLFASARQIPNLTYNYSVHTNEAYFQKPYLDIGIPASSSAGQENSMEIIAYGCSNGTVQLSLNSSTVAFSPRQINSSFYSVQVWRGSFDPGNGTNAIYAKYTLECAGKRYNASENFSTSSYSLLSASGPLTYSAYISGRNESISYPLSNESVILLSTSSFCTMRTWTGYPYSMSLQCGSGSWGYMVNVQRCMSRGDPTITVCINPYPSGYSLKAPSPYGANYIFSANLSITGKYRLNSHLSNASDSSPVLLSGKQVGSARVVNVSAESALPSVEILEGTSIRYVNSTVAEQYQQAKNNLYSTLAFYNNTTLDIDPSIIDQVISSYENAEARLVASAANSSAYPCSVQPGYLYCRPQSPFYYTINANVSSAYITGNQTLSYAGSAILVNN